MITARKYGKPVGLLALLGVAIAFPLVFSDPTYTTIAVFALIFASAASGWNIFAGYTGYIALGHAAYFGIGAYALAIICQRYNIPGGWEPIYLIPLCGLIAGVFAIPLGAIALRTRRHTFIVVTIATFFIVQLMAFNLRGLTNGSTGLDMPIPFQWGAGYQGGNQSIYNLPFYFTALALTIVALAVSWFIRHSKYGLGLLAIRDDEDRARGLGVRTGSSKLSAFVISAIFAGMAGALFAYFIGSVQPQFDFDPLFDLSIALMTFLGGIGTRAGPILGALVLEFAQQWLTLYFTQDGLYLILYGVLFLVVILLLPRGVIPSLQELWAKGRARGRIGPLVLPVKTPVMSAGTTSPPTATRMTGQAGETAHEEVPR
jgi:branched-chain amino acid transport system permease protein